MIYYFKRTMSLSIFLCLLFDDFVITSTLVNELSEISFFSNIIIWNAPVIRTYDNNNDHYRRPKFKNFFYLRSFYSIFTHLGRVRD